jgi:hypothetical protein
MKFKTKLLTVIATLLPVLALGDPGTAPTGWSPTPERSSSLNPVATQIGKISLSVDGLGTMNASGIIQAEKPAGATVRKAYFAAATTGFTDHMLSPGDVKIDNVDVVWGTEIANSISSYNYFAEVTAMVKPKLDAAAAGRVDFTIDEINSALIDGEILAVIWNDPNETQDVTIIILFGAQDIAGDQFVINLADPIDLSDPSTRAEMSLGISYGYQIPAGTGQVSLIDVNGSRLTSSAGGQDDADGVGENGNLLTAGGLDDSPANPPDPNAPPTDFDYDDELYDLKPFMTQGDLQITVFTQNPSYDDNIFFGAFNLTARAGIGVIPTLTERGLIIFSILLLGWMAWVIVRRRKRVRVGI